MANKIFYWCPFIDKVGTVQAVINSAHSIAKFDRNYKPIILNTVGEWDDYRADILKKNIQIKNFRKKITKTEKDIRVSSYASI